MSSPSTQDRQYVTSAPMKNFSGFTINANSAIDKNIERTFNEFVKTTLADAGSDSDYILSTIHAATSQYQFLLDAFKSSDATDLIIEGIKKNAVNNSSSSKKNPSQQIVQPIEHQNRNQSNKVVIDFIAEVQMQLARIKKELATRKQSLESDRSQMMRVIDVANDELRERLRDDLQKNTSELRKVKSLISQISNEGNDIQGILNRIQTRINGFSLQKTLDNSELTTRIGKSDASSSSSKAIPQKTEGSKISLKASSVTTTYVNSTKTKVKAESLISNKNRPKDEKPTTPSSIEQPQKSITQSSTITANGVISQLGVIRNNISKMIGDQKFSSNFTLQYQPIQNKIDQTLNGISKEEEKAQEHANKIENYVDETKKKKSKFSLSSLLLSAAPMAATAAFTIVGGLILVTLARIAVNKWAKTYMPDKKDATKYTIFGIEIPFVGQIKDFAVGIRNFVMVGLPNAFGKLKLIVGKLKNGLFGRNGIFKSATETMNTLRKIGLAWILGVTKKVTGTGIKLLIKGIAFALNFFLPGSGIVLNAIADFVPMVFHYAATQIALFWSNRKAEKEARFEALSKKTTASGMNDLLVAKSNAIKNFVPLDSIPSLQTPKAGGSNIKRSAIMRHVGASTTTSTEYAEEAQKRQYEKETSDAAKTAPKRYESNAFAKSLSSTLKGKPSDSKDGRQIYQQVYDKTILPQIQKIDAYVDSLRRGNRFNGVRGPLYDVQKGWNRGYRVLQSDLNTPIPLTPFEGVHDKSDISFGKPSSGDESYIGVMPFTWLQNGVQISANPVQFEIERALRIRNIWCRMWNQFTSSMASYTNQYGGGYPYMVPNDVYKDPDKYIKTNLFPSYEKEWRRANYVVEGGYAAGVYYKDKFSKFLEKFRNGEIENEQNNIVTAYKDSKVKKIDRSEARKNRRLAIEDSYDVRKVKDKESSSGIKGFFNSMIGRNEATNRKKKIAESIRQFGEIKFNGIRYADVRDLMFNNGLDQILSNSQITNPIGLANSVLGFFLDNNWIQKSSLFPSDPLLQLMGTFFVDSKIVAGSKASGRKEFWNNMKNDKPSMSAFAQSILEMIAYNVVPQWNLVEQLMKTVISQDGNGTPRLVKAISTLLGFFSWRSILEFLGKHIRFSNIRTRVVGEDSEDEEIVKQIFQYKTELGILSDEQKNKFIQDVSVFPNDADGLMKQMNKVMKQIPSAELEVSATGKGVQYLQNLKNILSNLHDRYVELQGGDVVKEKQPTNTKIKPKSSDAVVKVVKPVKTKEQIEKERQERIKREEQERARIEAERKKRLELEAKRKEEFVIAQAKIAAAEQLRKQEQNYENILSKMVADPATITDAELKSVGNELDTLKKEAENRLQNLPREERDLKLALIRGDKISPMTFNELKETSVGLHSSLQSYMEEVGKIPCGSVVTVVNSQSQQKANVHKSQDFDEIDLGNL